MKWNGLLGLALLFGAVNGDRLVDRAVRALSYLLS